jgi:hypothetical protein
MPELGVAERKPVVESASTTRKIPVRKTSVPNVTRAFMEIEFFFME